MNNLLIDDLLAPEDFSPHGDLEAFYKTVKRTGPDGETLVIDVEIYHHWNMGIIEYATIPLGLNLSRGLAIQDDAVLMLSRTEREAFDCDQAVMDYIKECRESDADIKEHNEYYDANR